MLALLCLGRTDRSLFSEQGEAHGSSNGALAAPLEGDDLDEDEQHLEAAEQFESRHNFRFEV